MLFPFLVLAKVSVTVHLTSEVFKETKAGLTFIFLYEDFKGVLMACLRLPAQCFYPEKVHVG